MSFLLALIEFACHDRSVSATLFKCPVTFLSLFYRGVTLSGQMGHFRGDKRVHLPLAHFLQLFSHKLAIDRLKTKGKSLVFSPTLIGFQSAIVEAIKRLL